MKLDNDKASAYVVVFFSLLCGFLFNQMMHQWMYEKRPTVQKVTQQYQVAADRAMVLEFMRQIDSEPKDCCVCDPTIPTEDITMEEYQKMQELRELHNKAQSR